MKPAVQLEPEHSTPQPLRLCFDASAQAQLRGFFLLHPELFQESSAPEADLVVFGTDEILPVRRSRLFQEFRHKSVCITETDTPTFYLPGLYAANIRSIVTGRRTRTMNYFLSMLHQPNPEVRQRIGMSTEKHYLYSFMGGSNSWARKRLFRHVTSKADTYVQSTDAYNHWSAANDLSNKAAQRQRYAEVMAASKFVLCPRGCGVSSYRLFETMSLGVAPVILSDRWRPVEGVDWSFALFIPEKEIPRLDEIVRCHESEWKDRGRLAAEAYQKFFAPNVIANTIYKQMDSLHRSSNTGFETAFRVATRVRATVRQNYWKGYGVAKTVVLKTCYRTGIRVPVQLNRPLEEQIQSTFADAMRPGSTCRSKNREMRLPTVM